MHYCQRSASCCCLHTFCLNFIQAQEQSSLLTVRSSIAWSLTSFYLLSQTADPTSWSSRCITAKLQIQHKSGFGKQDEFFVHPGTNLPIITEACLRFRIQGLGNLYDSGFKVQGFRVQGWRVWGLGFRVQNRELVWYNLGCNDKLCSTYNQLTCLFKVQGYGFGV